MADQLTSEVAAFKALHARISAGETLSEAEQNVYLALRQRLMQAQTEPAPAPAQPPRATPAR
ncbi:MAG: hypothetical protein U0228_26145 [Myxococcaceae bacterium]